MLAQEMQRKAAFADYFVDAGAILRLESARCRDSLAYLLIIDGRSQGAKPLVIGVLRFGLIRLQSEITNHDSRMVRGCVHDVAEVKIQEGESIESALRRFKRKVQQEDIIKDIKKHSFYLKPGDKRRAKQALARKRNRKKLRRELE